MECVVFWGAWDVALTGGEYWFTLSFSVSGWRQATSRSHLLDLSVLVLRDVGVPWFLLGGEGGVGVFLVGLCWGIEKGDVVTLSLAAF